MIQSLSFKLEILALLCLSLASASHTSLGASRILNSVPDLQKFFQIERLARPNTLEKIVGRNGYSQGRKLQQTGLSSVCEWDPNESQCVLSSGSLSSLLEDADNSVSEYLLKIMTCDTEDEATCLDNGCEWYPGTGCSTTHEDFRDLHSADCLEEVDHLIDATAGALECAAIATESECVEVPSCLWEGACTFDTWYYYYGIDAKGFFPDSYNEISEIRLQQIFTESQSAFANGEIADLADLLTWDPPPLECPFGYEEIECDFVEAFTPLHLALNYCVLKYQTTSSLLLCDADEYCQLDQTQGISLCTASLSVQQEAVVQAYQTFIDGIEDPEARKYQSTNFQCGFTTDEESCTGNCTWIPDAELCTLSSVWLYEEIGNLVKPGDDPVCEYFRLNLDSGCVYREGQEECEVDDKCTYSAALGECGASRIHLIEYAIQASGSNGAYTATRSKCTEAQSQLECLDIKALEVGDEPTDNLLYGVEALPSIVEDEGYDIEEDFEDDDSIDVETTPDEEEEESSSETEESTSEDIFATLGIGLG